MGDSSTIHVMSSHAVLEISFFTTERPREGRQHATPPLSLGCPRLTGILCLHERIHYDHHDQRAVTRHPLMVLVENTEEHGPTRGQFAEGSSKLCQFYSGCSTQNNNTELDTRKQRKTSYPSHYCNNLQYRNYKSIGTQKRIVFLIRAPVWHSYRALNTTEAARPVWRGTERENCSFSGELYSGGASERERPTKTALTKK